MEPINVLFVGVPRLTWEIVAPTLAAEPRIALAGHVRRLEDAGAAFDVAIVTAASKDCGAILAVLAERAIDVIGIAPDGRDGFMHVVLGELTASRMRDLIVESARAPFREPHA